MKRPHPLAGEESTEAGDDSLDDLFGNLDDEGEQGPDAPKAPGHEPASPASDEEAVQGDRVGRGVFRAALARIDSHEEASAQRWSADARTAQTILGCGQTCPPSEVTLGQVCDSRKADEHEEDSWLEWQGEGGARRLTLQCARAALQRLKRDSRAKFPYQDVIALLQAARRGALASDRAVRDVAVPGTGKEGGRVLVIGDTHGQLDDVLWIFFKHGEPSASHNVYVFNGDVADRGKHALEIFMLLVLYSTADPGSVYLNRGNHEDSFLTSVYGYRDECLEKYGREVGLYLYTLSRELFNNLALGCVVDAGPGRRYFIVHAGLPRNGESLDQIREINFRRELPAPPKPGDEELFFDCMWSDPQEKGGSGPNVRGPHVRSFGPEVTKAFLERSSVDVVIRSHAVPSTGRGFEWHHGGKVLTVFSASNYVGTAGNMGGVAAICRGEPIENFEHFAGPRAELVRLEAHVQHASEKLRVEAVRLTERRRKRRGRAAGLEKMQLQTLDHVKERVVACKSELFEFWAARDESADFHVSPAFWREGMAHFMGHDLPWEWIMDSLEVSEDEGPVPYTRFLQRFRVAQVGEEEVLPCASPSPSPKRVKRSLVRGWQGVVVRRVFEALLLADLQLRDTLAALDRNADGIVGTSELAAIVADCGMALSDAQCQTMMRAFKTRKGTASGNMKLFEFLDSITVTFASSRRPAATGEDSWVPKALGKIARVLLADAYAHTQGGKAKASAGAASPGGESAAESASTSAMASPIAASGSPPPPWKQTSVAELLAEWFRKADTDANGYLSAAELESALAPLAPELEKRGVPSDEASRRAIVKYMDWHGSGRVNYMELLAAMMPAERGQDDQLGPFGEDLLETVSLAIFSNRATLLCTLRERFDPQGTGSVGTAEFVEGLAAVSAAVLPKSSDGGLLPRAQIEALASELSGFNKGRVEYEAFINSFHIVEGLGWARRGSISFDS